MCLMFRLKRCASLSRSVNDDDAGAAELHSTLLRGSILFPVDMLVSQFEPDVWPPIVAKAAAMRPAGFSSGCAATTTVLGFLSWCYEHRHCCDAGPNTKKTFKQGSQKFSTKHFFSKKAPREGQKDTKRRQNSAQGGA